MVSRFVSDRINRLLPFCRYLAELSADVRPTDHSTNGCRPAAAAAASPDAALSVVIYTNSKSRENCVFFVTISQYILLHDALCA